LESPRRPISKISYGKQLDKIGYEKVEFEKAELENRMRGLILEG